MVTGAQAPVRLGRYELLALLATGGMGEIFLARLEGAEGFEKLYVVKRILPHLADDARFRQMLIAEARIAARMAHANICQVYELSEADGQLYIVMEYLEGVTLLPLLRRASRRGPLELGFIASVASQICDALHYAHEIRDQGESLNIIHRDVTPANIMLTESGVAKVLDFGIAKVKNDASANTEDGTVKGKYAYMAPEQLRGGSIDRRVDVFALGVVLFEMLALRRLFQRKTDYLTFRAVMEQPIPDVRAYRPDCPDQLANVLTRALERDPNARWDTARQFGAAVTDAISPFRAWTQGEIGDFVHDNFASELGRRSAQVQTAVHRMPRTTMPLIAQPGTEGATEVDDDDDDGFPSIETEIESGVAMAPAARLEAPRHATPQPFSLETSTSGPSIEPIQLAASSGPNAIRQARTTNTTGSVVVVAQRNVLWPIVAITAVAITAVALYLVWQQSQQPQQPASVVIEQRPDTSPGPSPSPPPANDPRSLEGTTTTTPPPQPPMRKPPAADYGRLLAARQVALQKCVADNGGNDALPLDAAMKIDIAPTGAATTVLSPAKLDRTELGACIKREVAKVRFPAAEHELNIRLRR